MLLNVTNCYAYSNHKPALPAGPPHKQPRSPNEHSQMRHINLEEHQPAAYTLSFAEQRALRSTLPSVRIEPSPDTENDCILTPASTVGAVEADGLSVLIQPKIPIPNLLSLACYAIGAVKLQPTEFDFPQAPALPDLLALALAKAARSAFSRGLLHGYLAREEALLTVRGRIQLSEQLRRRPGVLLPIETRYDEFTSDILPNQLVKAAATRLARAGVRSPEARRGLRWITAILDNVSPQEWPSRNVPDVRFDRLNERYRNVLALARLILRHDAFEPPRGTLRASGFLMNMNALFQEFVTAALREKLNLPPNDFGEKRIATLDEENRVRLKPDLVWLDAGRPVFAGDAKYKNIASNNPPNPDRPILPGDASNNLPSAHRPTLASDARSKTLASNNPPSADLYQLLAYAIALDLPGGLLIYAKGEQDPATHTIRNSGKRLEIAALDLSGSLDSVLERVETLADVVRRLRNDTRRAQAAA